MNRHLALDGFYNRVSRVMVRRPFSGGIESASVAEHLDGITVTLPDVLPSATATVPVTTLRGPANPSIAVLRWIDDSAPVVIHHHGTGQRDFVKAARQLWMQPSSRTDVNIIALGAPYHDSRKSLMATIGSVEGWVLLHTVGVATLDAVLRHPSLQSSRCRLATGYSLGATIAFHHHLYVGSADAYLPIASGYRVGDVMLSSTHRGRATPEVIAAVQEHLNLPGRLDPGRGAPILPVLGRHDRLNHSALQAAELGDEVDWWDCGHISGAGRSMAPSARASLDRVLDRVMA